MPRKRITRKYREKDRYAYTDLTNTIVSQTLNFEKLKNHLFFREELKVIRQDDIPAEIFKLICINEAFTKPNSSI